MNIFERIKEDVEHLFGALTKEDKKVVHDLTDEVAKLRADVDGLLGRLSPPSLVPVEPPPAPPAPAPAP
jgi:hypothetical protein